MIVQCESCQSKFNLDERLIKAAGSKVRCSICKHTFTVFPPQDEVEEEQSMIQDLDEELEETVALDSPPAFDQEGEGLSTTAEESTDDFDQAFQEAIDEGLTDDSLSQPLAGEESEPEEFFEPDEEIGGDVTKGDEKRISEKEKKEKPTEPSPGKKKKSRSSKWSLIILLIIFFLILFSAVVYFRYPNYLPDFLWSQKQAPSEILSDQGVKNLTFKEVSGSFLQSDMAGQRFVVKGKVRNNYSDPRSYLLVKAEILDEKGEVVRRKLAYAGNVFTENELKKMPMEEIDKIMKNRSGRKNLNLNIMPEADVPFMVIFENLPPNLSEFSVEAVSSSSGS
jgi:predicted Zn finger-like uncharacterized protein